MCAYKHRDGFSCGITKVAWRARRRGGGGVEIARSVRNVSSVVDEAAAAEAYLVEAHIGAARRAARIAVLKYHQARNSRER